MSRINNASFVNISYEQLRNKRIILPKQRNKKTNKNKNKTQDI